MICGCSTKQHSKERDHLQFGCGLDNDKPAAQSFPLQYEGRGTSLDESQDTSLKCQRNKHTVHTHILGLTVFVVLGLTGLVVLGLNILKLKTENLTCIITRSEMILVLPTVRGIGC
jgi:hypothetical protein